ncbi:hypothetical protein [Corallococcus sp. AS-1-6]|uniref:hypothetical protein n=1 Tax=Corallococcus sp. AS-1-6 TaxID=2874599 RepID=UPI001CBF1FAD|nr:hypothetical protein [Corallococcus sp. AS-1-6]MBZ4376067.1 hypothetical protein [Corallococcus sp. AS-1-6]
MLIPDPDADVTHDTTDLDGFSTWVDTLVAQRKTSDLKVISAMFLEKAVAAKRPAFDVVIAASKVRCALDKLEPNASAEGSSAVFKLPRDRWWKLFIEGRHHGSSNTHQAMIFDRQQSPGFYNAMTKAFTAWLKHPAAPDDRVDFDRYHEMHAAVTRGVLKLNDVVSERARQRFVPVPHELSHYTNFPIDVQGHEVDWESLLELSNDGDIGTFKTIMKDLGAPRDVLEHWVERDWATSLLTRSRGSQLLWGTAYEPREAKGKVNALFARYYLERDQAAQQSAKEAKQELKLRAIVRVIRALHVGHFYADANGRLNTMLLLNYLLLQEGFSPVILFDTAIFGGALRMYDLVDAVREGMKAFEEELEDSKRPPRPLHAASRVKRCAICDHPASRTVTCRKCRGIAAHICDGKMCQPSLWALAPHEPRSVVPLLNQLCEACG